MLSKWIQKLSTVEMIGIEFYKCWKHVIPKRRQFVQVSPWKIYMMLIHFRGHSNSTFVHRERGGEGVCQKRTAYIKINFFPIYIFSNYTIEQGRVGEKLRNLNEGTI